MKIGATWNRKWRSQLRNWEVDTCFDVGGRLAECLDQEVVTRDGELNYAFRIKTMAIVLKEL